MANAWDNAPIVTPAPTSSIGDSSNTTPAWMSAPITQAAPQATTQPYQGDTTASMQATSPSFGDFLGSMGRPDAGQNWTAGGRALNTVGQAIHSVGSIFTPAIQAISNMAPETFMPNIDPTSGTPIDYGKGLGAGPTDQQVKDLRNMIPQYNSAFDQARPGDKDAQGHNNTPDLIGGLIQAAPFMLGDDASVLSKIPLNKKEAVKLFFKELSSAVTTGAAAGANQDVQKLNQNPGDFLGQKGLQGLEGAGIGLGGKVAGDIISPTVNSQTQLLLDKGINPTTGQLMRQSGNPLIEAPGWIEALSSGLPLIGSDIRAAQEAGVMDLNKAVGNDALNHAGLGSVSDDHTVGSQVSKEVYDKLQNGSNGIDGYEQVIPKMKVNIVNTPAVPAVTPTPYIPAKRKSVNFPNGQPAVPSTPGSPAVAAQIDPVIQQLAVLQGTAKKLGAEDEGKYNAIVQDRILGKLMPNPTGATVTGQDLKDGISGLRQDYKNFQKSQDPNDRNLGDHLEAAYDAIKSGMVRDSAPEDVARLNALDDGYHTYAAVTRPASAKAINQQGTFTPAQMGLAVRADDGSVGKGSASRGQARNQDLSNAANAVLTKLPDSETSGRAATGNFFKTLATSAVGGGVGAEAANHAGTLGELLALAAAAKVGSTTAYSQTGQALLKSILTGRQGPIANALSQGAKTAIPAMAGSVTSGQPLSTQEQMQQLMQPTNQRDGGYIQKFADGGSPFVDQSQVVSDALANGPAPEQEQAQSYNPTLRDQLASALMGSNSSPTQSNIVSNLVGSTGLGTTQPSLVDATPLGITFNTQEAIRNGDPQQAVMGLLPGAAEEAPVASAAIHSLVPRPDPISNLPWPRGMHDQPIYDSPALADLNRATENMNNPPLSRADKLPDSPYIVFDTRKKSGTEGVFPSAKQAEEFMNSHPQGRYMDYGTPRQIERLNPSGPESYEYDKYMLSKRIGQAVDQVRTANDNAKRDGGLIQRFAQGGQPAENYNLEDEEVAS